MERGVGQQDAEAAVLAQAGKARRIRPLFQQDDGPPGALQQGGFVLRDKAELPRRVQIAAEDGQGLFGAALAAAQAEDGRLVPGVAGQVDAAGPFDRDRPACGQGPLGQGDGVAGQGLPPIVQIKGPGPAGGAAPSRPSPAGPRACGGKAGTPPPARCRRPERGPGENRAQASAARMRPARWPASWSSPSPVRADSWNSGPWGLTPR